MPAAYTTRNRLAYRISMARPHKPPASTSNRQLPAAFSSDALTVHSTTHGTMAHRKMSVPPHGGVNSRGAVVAIATAAHLQAGPRCQPSLKKDTREPRPPPPTQDGPKRPQCFDGGCHAEARFHERRGNERVAGREVRQRDEACGVGQVRRHMLVGGQPVSGQEVVRRLQLDAKVVVRVARVQEPRDDDHRG